MSDTSNQPVTTKRRSPRPRQKTQRQQPPDRDTGTLELIPDHEARQLQKGQSTLPLFSNSVAAGFPSPADDHLEGRLDLNEHLIKHPTATFFLRVSGDSMIGAGIHDNDILVIDRSVEPHHGKIVIAVVDGEFTVKRLIRKNGRVLLMPENEAYAPIEITDEHDLLIWGVVTGLTRQF